MDTIQMNDLRKLAQPASKPCVSVYMPTHVAGEAGQEDRIRLRNLLDQAEEELAGNGVRAVEARELLAPVRGLAQDPAFWGNRSHGLALFVAPGMTTAFRLPAVFAEQVRVAEHFVLKPLLGLVGGSDRFLVLALSQNKVRLFYGDRYQLEEVESGKMPASMEETLNYAGADRGSQVHSAMRGDLGKQAAVFHGQGGEADTHKDDVEAYFRQVAAALVPLLRDEGTPLLLAGVEYLLPIFRRVNRYAHLVDSQLVGNCDYLTAHELHERAWPIVEPALMSARQEMAARYRKWSGTTKATSELEKILPAAGQGRVESLFVDVAAQGWGRFDDRTGEVCVHPHEEPGDTDLLELAAVQTLSNRGTVYAVRREEMPEGGMAAAVMRY